MARRPLPSRALRTFPKPKPPKLKRFRCNNGHAWNAIDANITFDFSPYHETTLGPICTMCITEFIKKNFSAKEYNYDPKIHGG